MRGVYIDSISYGIYLIHFPVIVLLHRITFFANSGITLLLRFALFVPLVIWLGHILEKKFQPWARGKLYPKAPVAVHNW